MKIRKVEIAFLFLIYFLGLGLRLIPRLGYDPHLLTFGADIWYRLCMAQFLLDNGSLPVWDIRYSAYGNVPTWYTPLGLYFFVFLSKISSLDLPTVTSRMMPFFESLSIIPFYFFCRYLFNNRIAMVATLFLGLTPSFVFWTGIATPQSFTMFCIPITLLLWILFLEQKYLFNSRWGHLVGMGFFFAINFLTHLTFFNSVIILLLVHVACIHAKKGTWKDFAYLFVPLFLSQLLTVWWWLPNNLYWWWSQGLSTSTAFFDGKLFLKNYGLLTAILGHAAFIVIVFITLFKRKGASRLYLIPIYWALFPLVESHMEIFLQMIQREDLVWNTMIRPIEGFRFYSFLAQPFALCFALSFEHILASNFVNRFQWRKASVSLCVMIPLSIVLFVDMIKGYELAQRFQYHMVNLHEIKAAQWYRNHSESNDRILADYYTAQMFSGICAGKALLGSMFPLKGANIPYISDSWMVLYDIHNVYKTDDPKKVLEIFKKYKCTHLYLSKNSLRYIEFVLNGYGDMNGLKEGKFDVLVNKDFSKTLLDPQYFQLVYEDGDVRILKRKQ